MFANSTPIADSETSFKPIEEFLDGDEVMVADVSGGGITWRQANVRYSAGTGPDGHQPSMVYITYGGDRVVIVGPDQLFMLPEGRLKRADRLVPVQDDLVDAHGNAVALTDVQRADRSL